MVPVLEVVVNYNNQSGPVIPIVHNLYMCRSSLHVENAVKYFQFAEIEAYL